MRTAILGLSFGGNDFSPFVPEWWANESLAILEENMVVANLVHRDFEDEFAEAGDIVNTRRPSEFTALRKTKADNITVQDATATNVAVSLDQHIHVSFQVNDLDERSSMKNLVDTYLRPAGLALARAADRVILGQYPRFLANMVGGLGQGSPNSAWVLQNMASLNVEMDINKCYEDGRKLIFSPLTKSYFLGSGEVHKVNEAGSSASRVKGALGETLGFDLFSAQNMADVLLNATGVTKTGAVATTAAVAGSLTVVTDGWGAATDYAAGRWCRINGIPNRIESVSGVYVDATTDITLTLKYPLPSGAALATPVVVYAPVLINQAVVPTGYAAGYNKGIEWDGGGTGYEPQVGQGVQIGSAVYTVIAKPTATSILLDRSLEASAADGDSIYPLPHGSYSLAFHRNAITAAIRPIAPVPAGTGARSSTVNYNGLTVRATMGYDMTSQNMIVTLDFLMGVQVLDTNLGAVLLA